MKNKSLRKLVVAVSLLAAASGTAFAQSSDDGEYKTIRTIGISNPVCDGGIDNPAELAKYVSQNRDDFVQMVASSNWPGDVESLISRIQDSEFEPVLLPIGTTFEWMGVRRRTTGETDTVAKLRWGGDGPLEAYRISATDDAGNTHTFVIPKECCNLAVLTQVAEAPVAEAEPEPAPLVAAAPSVIPFIAPFIGYEDRVRDECPAHEGERHGNGHQTENDGVIGGAILGLLKPVNDKTSLLAQLGGAYNFDDSTHSTAFADIGVNHKVGANGFIGGGVGIWDINDSDNTDLNAFETSKGTAQWFAEARALFDEPGDNTIFMTGLRFLFDQ